MNTPLGAAIEASVVDNLNSLRELWDPEGKYEIYSFVRQAQVFPDVRLQTTAPGVPEKDRILMGIELKGWFVLAKEGEPSFRYKVSPNVCSAQDLMVVFPWVLDEVVSGAPKLLRPFVEEAKYAAEHRNYYWEHMRGASGTAASIKLAAVSQPYPAKGAKFNDEAVSDQGKNFGRVARGRLMTDFIDTLLLEPISGIPAKYWQAFLRIFSEGVEANVIEKKLKGMREEAEKLGLTVDGLDAFDRVQEGLRDLISKS
ncbi:hypothetical protein [Pseudomonas aeruginosa]|uniref:hypothetical protein n=1 Tax=Pseudomonas aeruginosa TaxID=287 RepID=UPI0021F1107A|nr:hypothetical protein [Pseudomonas aeruginosa]MCV4111270.1 hypothetical protein [Pseudomonas aeruginosa]MCV4244142.1 hypothetical protein [Pseudomonas aeruginosa]MCV4250095.1 hypothetical protein [Pseudomonas aeruginosa]